MRAGTAATDGEVRTEGTGAPELPAWSGFTLAGWVEGLAKSGSIRTGRVLIPSAAMIEEAAALAGAGCRVLVLDADRDRIRTLKQAARERRFEVDVMPGDFLEVKSTFYGTVDLLVERTRLPEVEPIRRAAWAFQAARAIPREGRLAGLFRVGRSAQGPPWSLTEEELRKLVTRNFVIEELQPAGPPSRGRLQAWRGLFRRK